MGSSWAIKAVTLNILKIFPPSEHVNSNSVGGLVSLEMCLTKIYDGPFLAVKNQLLKSKCMSVHLSSPKLKFPYLVLLFPRPLYKMSNFNPKIWEWVSTVAPMNIISSPYLKIAHPTSPEPLWRNFPWSLMHLLLELFSTYYTTAALIK